MIHCGTHGTLEWLPGKAVALSDTCAPARGAGAGAADLSVHRQQSGRGRAGEAAHRRGDHRPSDAASDGRRHPRRRRRTGGPVRRIRRGAVARSAPRRPAGRADHGARAGDRPGRGMRRRAGRRSGGGAARSSTPGCATSRTCGSATGCTSSAAPPDDARRAAALASLRRREQPMPAAIEHLIGSCAEAEMRGLLAALDGRFVPPGPAGAPGRGRLDVLPTGRNLYSVDPRAVPTRTAWEIGRRTAEAMLDPPRAGSRRLAAPDRARSLGQRDDAHRRRRSGAGASRCSACGRAGTAASEPGRRLRHPAAGGA